MKDRRHSLDLYSLLGVQSGADVVRHGGFRWFEHLKCMGVDDWLSACRNVVVAGMRGVDRGRKTWKVCEDDMKLFGLQPEWALFRDVWMDFKQGANV